MVLNDWRMARDGFPLMRMWNTWDVTQTVSATAVFQNIRNVIASAPGQKLKNLIFHGHGQSGGVRIGRETITMLHMNEFKSLEGKVEHIWFVSCVVASDQNFSERRMLTWERRVLTSPRYGEFRQQAANAGMPTRDYLRQRALSGTHFCRSIANAIGAVVTASVDDQLGGPEVPQSGYLPYGVLETFEGFVLTFKPGGAYQVTEENPFQRPGQG